MPANPLPENSQFGKSIYEGFFTFMDKAASSLSLFVLCALIQLLHWSKYTELHQRKAYWEQGLLGQEVFVTEYKILEKELL